MLRGAGVLFYCIAPTKRHYQCSEIALRCGADYNNKTRTGTPVLMFACETANMNEDLCLALLEAGADPTITDEVLSAIVQMISSRGLHQFGVGGVPAGLGPCDTRTRGVGYKSFGNPRGLGLQIRGKLAGFG